MAHAAEPIRTSLGTQTLERGLDLLTRIADGPMTIGDLSASTGLTLSATRRLLGGLANQGFAVMQPNGRFRAGPKLVHLGIRAQSNISFVEVAREHLSDLSLATGISSFLGERDGDHSVHLLRVPGRKRIEVATPAGTRSRLSETSMGKALMIDDEEREQERLFAGTSLADWRGEMREARRTGFAVRTSPPPDNFRAVAAPIRDARGKIIAAISVVSMPQYTNDDDIGRLSLMVRDKALAISAELGFCA